MTKTVCALGFFDGVHLAHREILQSCVSYAKKQGLKSIAITFEKSPAEYFGKKIKYLSSLDEKKKLMYSLGIDEVYPLPCTKEMLSLEPEEFFNNILLDTLHASALFCGFNYNFGKGAKGDISLLKKLCDQSSVELFVKPCIFKNGIAVSSSEIRKALSIGDIELANSLLKRPFEVKGSVLMGKKLGRSLGFPTANIYPESLPDLPYGVYATKTLVDEKEYISVTNVGVNPTVQDGNLRIETFITDFDCDIYNKEISVRFFGFLRKECTFSSLELLKEQVNKDISTSIEYFKK